MGSKTRILSAAAEEFAAKGYHGATVRDICRRADVNLALVNYHFKSKEALYREMFEFLFRETAHNEVFDRPCGDFGEWKAILREWVEKVLLDISSREPGHRCRKMIFGRELLDPSDIFPNIYQTYIRPTITDLAEHFRKVLPSSTGEDEIYIRVFSVMSDTLFYFHDREIIRLTFPGRDFGVENIRAIADHITGKACCDLKKNKVRKTSVRRRK